MAYCMGSTMDKKKKKQVKQQGKGKYSSDKSGIKRGRKSRRHGK